MRKNRVYSSEFKKIIVEECLAGNPVENVRKKYNVPHAAVYGWLKRFINSEISDKKWETNPINAARQLKDLEIYTAKRIKELTDLNETLKEENETLKKTVSIFATYYKQAV